MHGELSQVAKELVQSNEMVIKTLADSSATSFGDNPFASQKPRRSQSASFVSHDRSALSQPATRLPETVDFRRMCIVTKSDLNRICDNLNRRQREKDDLEQEIERKRAMAARSAEITRHWPNTILGARERKLELKKIREEQEEERKKLLDVEEERLAAERRREQIEKAKQLQYYETDRVRTFHKALLLTEVLKERELQIGMKKRMEQIRQTDEDEIRQQYQEAQNERIRAEREKNENRAKDRATLSQYHLAQIEKKKAHLLEEKQRDRQEGDQYQNLAQQYALEQMELERFRKLKQKDVNTMFDQAMEDKRRVKEIEQKMDEEDDEELRIYAEAKKKITRIRRGKELEAHQEKQNARDQMIGFLGSLQKRAEADYDTQIFRAQAQREAKEQREEQEKLARQRQAQVAIDKHREHTVKRREVERNVEEHEDAEMNKKTTEADQLFFQYQQEKDRKRRQDAQGLSEFHLRQAEEQKERRRGFKSTDADEAQLDKRMSDIERQQYQDYTQRVISYMGENGRNTYPLKKVYTEEMKRFDQFNQGQRNPSSSTSSERKANNQNKKSLGDTKKHLGFQWEVPKE